MRPLIASIWDNEVLDEFTLPMGEWAKDVVFWITTKAGTALDVIEWPFEQLLTRIVDQGVISDSAYASIPSAIQWLFWPLTFGIREIPWLLVIAAFVAIGAWSRNLTVGIGAGLGLVVCGILGFDYWDFTVQTIGMIVVAVIICTIIGIPLGIWAARSDRMWNAIRPVLDGMQVIHPFVYLLPVIFFWGTGRTPGTIATMIFALPPIVRLTNLGIRQVPDDVVEAARAYGAPESRVLLDVQIPLARPAIMTGLNQTLLMALSMVGIVAIIAGGGLGQPILNGVNTLNIPRSVSSGLALYLVGVVLDRISQPKLGEQRPSLLKRIGDVWAGQPRQVEVPPLDLPVEAAVRTPVPAGEQAISEGFAAPRALSGGLVTVSGALLIFSSFLDWGQHSGLLSAYGRAADRDLAGESFSGLAIDGGSWFGIVTLVVGIMAVLVGIRMLLGGRLKMSSRALGPEGAIVLGFLGIGVPLAYILAEPSDRVAAYSDGPGVYLALLAGLGILLGGFLGAMSTRFIPTHEEPKKPTRLAIGALLGIAVLVVGVFSSWIYDERQESLTDLSADVQALVEEGVDPAVAAAQVAELAGGSTNTRARSTDGLASDGPQFGIMVLILAGLVALLVTVRALGSGSLGERAKWLIDVALVGLGAAVAALAFSWVLSIVRLNESLLVAGVGTLFTIVGGILIATSALPYIRAHILAAPGD